MSYYFAWQPYVSVAEKRRRAEREVAKLKKRGQAIAPVRIEGRKIAKSFWGQSWCTNLERYSDFANRLPFGPRTDFDVKSVSYRLDLTDKFSLLCL
jgi:hypothetical protein